MALTEQTKPYELLVRWDERTGVLRGAHIQFYTSVLRDGQFLSGRPSRAYPVGGAEFPLSDVMGTALQDTLAANATLTTERDTAQARVAELEALLAISHADDRESAIRAERDRRILAGVKVGDHWYHSDLQMQIQVMGMAFAPSIIQPGATIKTMDDGPQPATPQLAQALMGAIAQQMAALHAISDAAIADGTALADVQWPPTYADTL